MNEIDLSPDSPTDPTTESSLDREASEECIASGVCTMICVGTIPFAMYFGIAPLFYLSLALSIAFGMFFTISCFQPPTPEPAPPRYLSYSPPEMPTAEELRAQADAIDRSNNIISQHNFNTTLGWTCSYCGTTNIWKPGQTEVRCVHCGARYDGDILWDLKVIR